MPKRRTPPCYLCHSLGEKLPQASEALLIDPPVFHAFPVRNPLRSKWITICGLDEDASNISSIRICSRHFTATDYVDLNARQSGGRIRLQMGAYPTKLLPSQKPASSECRNSEENSITPKKKRLDAPGNTADLASPPKNLTTNKDCKIKQPEEKNMRILKQIEALQFLDLVGGFRKTNSVDEAEETILGIV